MPIFQLFVPQKVCFSTAPSGPQWHHWSKR